VDLLAALDDDQVFRPFFPSPSWDRWRVFCRALTGSPKSEAELSVYRSCTGRQEPPPRPASEGWVIAGRRSGKSRIASVIATHLAALAPTDRLALGELGVVLICAVDKAQAGVVLGYVKALFELPALRPLVTEETAESVTLGHRVKIEVRSSNYRRVRGVTLLGCVLDELAFLRDEASALPDVELYRALKPALGTTGGLILGISSPWAQRGLLWSKYRKHFGQDGDVLVWQADSRTMNPTLSAALIDEAVEDDPEAAASEWGGAFRSDLESYVSTAVLDACTSPGVVERPRVSGVSYRAFLDAAAGSGRDSFVAAVAHLEPRDGEAPFVVLDAVREVRPPFDPINISAELARFLRSYGITVAQADKYAGSWVSESFALRGAGGAGCGAEVDAVPERAAGVHREAGDLLDQPRLRAQLAGLERRRRAGGRDVVDHAPAGFDDVANAVCGVLVLAAALGTGGDEVLAANLADAPRARILDEREFALLGRGDY
jgi:hypothetical protein